MYTHEEDRHEWKHRRHFQRTRVFSISWFKTKLWVVLPVLAALVLTLAFVAASSVSAVDGVAYYDGPDDDAQLAAFVAANPIKTSLSFRPKTLHP